MPTIQVVKPFNLTLPDGTQKPFDVGAHTVDKEVAEHWYTKAHVQKPKAEKAGTEGGGAGAETGGEDPDKGKGKGK
jgi:hypothetical protein